MAFDLEQFRAGWRALCAEKGVDPLHGATTYQAILFAAERPQAPDSHWWHNPELWLDSAPYASATEHRVLFGMFQQSYQSDLAQLAPVSELPRFAVQPPRLAPCPYCGAEPAYQYFWARNSGGKQYICRQCDRVYTPERGKPNFSEEIKLEALRLYQAGHDKTDIARRLKVTRDTVRAWLAAFGIRTPAPGYPVQLREQAYAMRAAGVPLREISQTISVPPDRVRIWLIRKGLW